MMKTEMHAGTMILTRIFFTIFISVILISCAGSQEEPARSELIPEKEFTSILTEIHITDGLMANPKVQSWVLTIDSISTYHYIAEKHGYPKEIFDKTVHYYFISNPKKLIKIHDNILGTLSEMESRLEKEVMAEREHSTNVWPGERNYYFPDVDEILSPDFRVSVAGNRVYNLKFSATLFPDDQSPETRVAVQAVSADSLDTGKRYFFSAPPYVKDGIPYPYSIRIFVPTPGTVIVEGSLYETSAPPGQIQKHAYFEGITLSIPTSDK